MTDTEANPIAEPFDPDPGAPFDTPSLPVPDPHAGNGALTVWEKIADPLDFIAKVGTAFAESRMFGCANVNQGRILAMACLTEKKSPLEIKRRYHLIGGDLSMRADAMLAEFRSLHDGNHEIVSRTPERAEIELIRGRKRATFAFTWAEASVEDYCYTKEANKGSVPKLLKDGTVNPAALKDNWSTPRRRMQMLWARVVSDAVRAFAPEVNSGYYTPEELGGETPGETIDVDFVATEPQGAGPGPTVMRDRAAPAASASTPVKPVACTPPASAVAQGHGPTQAAMPPAPAPAATAVSPAPSPEEMFPSPSQAPGTAKREHLVEMKRIKDELKLGQDAWVQVVGQVCGGRCTSAKDLSENEGLRLLTWLQKQLVKRQSKSDLDKWAGDIAGGTAPANPTQG